MKENYEDVGDISKLKTGDIVTHRITGNAFVIMRVDSINGMAIGCRVIDVVNASEWKKYIGPK